MRDRPIQIAECLERDAQPHLRNRQRWIQPDRGAQLIDGWLEAPEALQRQSKVVTSFGMIRAQLDRCLERRERAVEVARPPPRRTEVILRIKEPGI
jgi:hypothetical protein